MHTHTHRQNCIFLTNFIIIMYVHVCMRCVNFILRSHLLLLCGSRACRLLLVSVVVLFGVNALQFISKAYAITVHLTSSHFVSMLFFFPFSLSISRHSMLSVTFNFSPSVFFRVCLCDFAIINYYFECIETKLQQNHFSSSLIYRPTEYTFSNVLFQPIIICI